MSAIKISTILAISVPIAAPRIPMAGNPNKPKIRIGSNIIFKIQDYAGGLPQNVQEKLFKEMITTKGKNGTGLGLFMSYSNIKAHFSGNLRYETSSEGTSFFIEIPM